MDTNQEIPSQIAQIECDEIGIDEVKGKERVSRFANQTLAPLIPSGARIITIDGFDGLGKSMLSLPLAETLEISVVGLDGYLNKNIGHFFEALNFNNISKDIDGALASCERVIVEGCLVEKALERIGKCSDFRIYVMGTTRMLSNPSHEWMSEFETLYGEKSTDKLIADMEEDARRFAQLNNEFFGGGSGELPSLERELILYHRKYRPHDNASLIVKRVHWN